MKIVLAVDEDKKTIVKRTGQSAYFAIYDDDKLVEIQPNKHHDGEHHTHRKDVEVLKNCDIILVQAVGENMKEALESIGLEVKKIRQKHGITADEVVRNFLDGNI